MKRLIAEEVQDGRGNVLERREWEEAYPPLTGHQIVATLNAVLGVWPLADAANAAGVEPEHLIAEAEAWAVAQEIP